ncbi:GNAT family N-acetyltransferase [Brachybacterium sacelli]|uniref:Acetyltransferase n=1 Tax=Brachybacterium sacelli TaxID=173364 RepID=A0ABS4WX59_9MICO|nr:putative acetyltransferase [Brachybacterium sacelli]
MTTTRSHPDLRRYASPDDIEPTFTVYQEAIRGTAARVYGPDQVEAWAGPRSTDLKDWDARRRRALTLVAEVDDTVVGFTDLLPDGLVDMLFVHPRAGGRGIARALLTAIMREARERHIPELHTFASRSAQPAFERLGFTLVAHRPKNTVRGVVVPNGEMRRRL